MLVFANSKEKTSPTIIGAGCRLTGDIKTDHIVQIHGEVFGNIKADTVIIGKGGQVIGRVNTREFFLHGSMNGPAIVESAHVFANATMTGTLSYQKLDIVGNNGLECKLQKRSDK